MDQVINWPQISGILDRVALVGLTWVASKGWITPSDVAGLATLIVGIAGAVYSFYINRNSSLASRACSDSRWNYCYNYSRYCCCYTRKKCCI